MSPTSRRPAGGGAKEQVARLLRLVPWLHAHGGVRLEEAARGLGSTPDQLLEDLKVLLMCGLPGGYPDDLIDVDLDALEDEDAGGVKADGVIKVSNADYLARPLQLTPSEATALIVALRTLRDGSAQSGAGPTSTEVVDRALGKLEAALASGPDAPASAATRVDVVSPDPQAAAQAALLAGTRAAVTDGLQRGRQLEITYYVPARDEESTRVIDPRQLTVVNGVDYLDAYCHSAEAPRVFRLDRIHEIRVLDLPIPDVADEAPRADLSRGFFEPSPDTQLVTLRLTPEAAWVPEYYPTQDVRRVDGDLEVDLLVGDPRWLRRLLLRLAPAATVVQPQEFTESFIGTAQRALGLYTDTGVE